MNEKTCVIYKGTCFQAEWYYDKNGYNQAYDYYCGLDAVRQGRFLILVERLADFGKIYDTTKFRNESDGIYAFKPQPDRYLCFFFFGRKIIVTNAFIKKTQKILRKEKRVSLKCKRIMKTDAMEEKEMTTYEQFFIDYPESKEVFEREKNEFALSEFVLEQMDKNKLSVRGLADKANVSPTIIQKVRKGKLANHINFTTFINVVDSLGYKVMLVKKANP